jgi:hypothetical protein
MRGCHHIHALLHGLLVCSLFIVRTNLPEHNHTVVVWCVACSILKCFICLSTYLRENTRGKAGKHFRSFLYLIAFLIKNTATKASMKTGMWLTPRGNSQCYVRRLNLEKVFVFSDSHFQVPSDTHSSIGTLGTSLTENIFLPSISD